MRNIKAGSSIIAAALLSAACVSLPREVREELSPPDGERPNNYEQKQGSEPNGTYLDTHPRQ